jgi:hypothetical protein
MTVPQKIKFTKQYKPIGFGDKLDPDTVEGHRNAEAAAEAAETRRYKRRMEDLAAEDAARREGLLSKVFGFFFSKSRR